MDKTKINNIPVYPQASSSTCGYHALHNTKIWLDNKLNPASSISFNDEDSYWQDFHRWFKFLLQNAPEQANIDFMNDYLWTESEIRSNVLETCYGEFLIKNHSDFEKIAAHITFMPELSYLHNNLMEVDRVNEISSVIQQLKASTRKFHAFIVSGGPNHWIALFVDGISPANIEISIADSSFLVGLPKTVTQFIECFTTRKSFAEFFSESIFLGFMKEYQEEALKLVFVGSSGSTSGSASNEAEQLEVLQSLSHSLKDVLDKIEKVDAKSRDLDELICEMLTNLVNLQSLPQLSKLNEELFQKIPDPYDIAVSCLAWDFMNEKSYGDCIVSRGIQTYWPKNQISLKNYQLDEIPALLLQQKHIESLTLTQNRLKDLPSIDFKALQYLDLSCNKLERVPSAVFTLVNLHSLNLSSNNLTEIDSNINKLSNLKQLSISDNKISNLPSSLDLPKLENLFGSKNSITNELWTSIASLTSLLSLEMSKNSITSAIEATKFSTLRILILTNNPIEDKTQLDDHAIKSKLPKLQILQL